MTILRTLFAATLAAAFVLAAHAADSAKPAAIMVHGTEKAIEPGTFKDGKVDFIVIREVPDGKIEVKYAGKVEGDTITGTVDRPLPDGNRQQVEWQATRAK